MGERGGSVMPQKKGPPFCHKAGSVGLFSNKYADKIPRNKLESQ